MTLEFEGRHKGIYDIKYSKDTKVLLIYPKVFLILGCNHPQELGMMNGKILDTQLSASTELLGYPAPLGRLSGSSAWTGTASFDWYQVDFIKHVIVSSIETQGDQSGYYVTEFKLSYGSNGVDFREYADIKTSKVWPIHYFPSFKVQLILGLYKN